MNQSGATGPVSRSWSWIRRHPALVALVAAAYVPLLASSPGLVPGDTKLYLYLDPGRLISDSPWTWDGRQMGGWVPHQNVGYLWPTGPWFAVFDALRVPDWIAHRLWLGTMLAVAGTGCYWLARRLGSTASSAIVAAAAYQFTPYVLPYISRTSALLLPWSFLPWLCGLALLADRRRVAVALFGLLILSSGGLNATALLMIAPGPVIWIAHQWRTGELAGRRALRSLGLLGGVSLLMSAWWLGGLVVQGRYGAAVLSYSESLVSTAATSSAPEVLRGLGYWLFYDRNDVVALTSAAADHQGSLVVLAAGGALVVLGLLGIVASRRWRWPLVTMVLAGVVLAVGPHPFDDPSPLWRLIVEHPRSAPSLALRSSTRAVPLIVLGLALGLGSLVDADRGRARSRRVSYRSHVAIVLLVMINAPATWSGRLIDPVMTRPQELPQSWYDVADFLDGRFDAGERGSVLLVPGLESAAYRWGYPVDPILPGLTKKPFVSRDWLPLGSAPFMDLLYALDDSFQSGIADPASIAPVARLLGADTVMVVNSPQYERFGTIRPERAAAIIGADPPGLRVVAEFGSPTIDQAPEKHWSEDVLGFPFSPLPEIVLYAVEDPSPPARISSAPVVVAADGTGLVDLASLGLLDGRDVVLSEAALSDDELRRAVSAAPEVIITDSNRVRAHHWRSSQDVWGATEPATGILLGDDLFDSRLPVFPRADDSSRTVIEDSGLTTRATSYGPFLTYEPEFRPAMAVDGDVRTAWRAGVNADPIGQMIDITTTDEPIDRLTIVQPHPAWRWITAVDYRRDGGPWTPLVLGPESRASAGQEVVFDVPARSVSIRITGIEALPPFDVRHGPGVGFAELLPDGRHEIVRVPERLVSLSSADTPVSFAFTRLRSDPYQPWRQDPESDLVRSFTTEVTRVFRPAFTVRLDPRAAERDVMSALGIGPDDLGASTRLMGSLRWWGLSALDGDPTTVWWAGVGRDPVGPARLTIPLSRPLTYLEMHQATGPETSRIERLELETSQGTDTVQRRTVVVPPPDSSGVSRIEVPPMAGDRLVLTIADLDPATVRDDLTGFDVPAPFGFVDLSSDGWDAIALPTTVDSGCRDDLVTLDGSPIPIRIEAAVSDLLDGRALPASVCGSPDLSLPPGRHVLSSVGPAGSAWELETVVLRSELRESHGVASPLALTVGRSHRVVSGIECTDSCWLELPDGWNVGWTRNDRSSSAPLASAAGRNLWQVDSGVESLRVSWSPQRLMWLALAVTLASVVALLAWARREPPVWPQGGRRRRPPSRVTVSGTILILGSLTVGPLWGIGLGILMAVLGRRPRMAAAAGVALVSMAMLFVVAQQIRTGVLPGFAWPATFARAHRPALAGLVLLWAAVWTMDHEPPLASRP